MDPLRIAVRAIVAYVFLRALVRLSGKRTVAQGSPIDFAMAIVLGDLIDDLLWAEAAMSQFVAATGMLVSTHSLFDYWRHRSGSRAQR